MISVKKSKCLYVTRISFIPRKITYNYFLTKYCSFPYTIQNLKKKFAKMPMLKLQSEIIDILILCPKLLKFLQGVDVQFTHGFYKLSYNSKEKGV